jgi:NADPH:quinone reductase-like Zn-dependent oxidoreductase
MKAIAFTQHGLPIEDPRALIDMDLPKPTPGPRDLLVQVRAVSVNPVDTKIRAGSMATEPRILGWDAVGWGGVVGGGVCLCRAGVGWVLVGSRV